MKTYLLIKQEKTTEDEVLKDLEHQTPGTIWAGKTNNFATDYVRHLTQVYKGNWSKGFLPKELFFDILLPEHGHSIEAGATSSIFPLDTPITKALDFYKNSNSILEKECMEAIINLIEK